MCVIGLLPLLCINVPRRYSLAQNNNCLHNSCNASLIPIEIPLTLRLPQAKSAAAICKTTKQLLLKEFFCVSLWFYVCS